MAFGRLADPDATIGTDPRSDPRMVAALAPLGLDGRLPQPSLTVDSPLEDRLAFVAETEETLGAVLEEFAQGAPIADVVTTTTTTIAGSGGNDVTVYISRPDNVGGALPCVVHTHGGGMSFLSAADTGYQRWREFLAATGLLVVGVEFRNAGGKLGAHPYPAGLDDLCGYDPSVAANVGAARVSHLIVSGPAPAAAISRSPCSTRRSGMGGYPKSPACTRCAHPSSNRWLGQPDDLPSLTENEDYFFSNLALALIGSIYC